VIVLLLTARGWVPRGYFAKRARTRPMSAVKSDAAEKELVAAGR
jgi:hypothetical protein